MNIKMQVISMLQEKRFEKWLRETDQTFEFVTPFCCPVAKYISHKVGEYGQVVVTSEYIRIYFHPKYKWPDLFINTPLFFSEFIRMFDGSFREYVKISGNYSEKTNRVKECDSNYVLSIIAKMKGE